MKLLSELKEGAGISWAAIRANKMRSVLTTLGIVIGIVTVTLMGTAIAGLDRAFLKNISFIGADVFYVDRFDWFAHTHDSWMKMRKRKRITLPQVNALRDQLTLARAVAPVVDSEASVRFQRRGSSNVRVVGTTDQYVYTTSVGISLGRFFSESESAARRPG
jgi:putative ABC transport system permease protein